MTETAIPVGLVGAGPWAKMVHAPTLAAGPETRLAGIWARRPEAALELAARHGVPAFEDYDALLAACEAVAFAVAPGAQPELALRAARAGKALLLEKPVAADLAGAERLTEAVAAAGVPSMLMLSYRFSDAVRAFIEQSKEFNALGGRATFISGGLLSGPFAFGWRLERGGLLDLGPHAIDLVAASLGPVTRVQAHGDPRTWSGLLLDHASGAVSEVSLCGTAALPQAKVGVELYGREGTISVDCMAGMGASVFANIRAAFADCIRNGRPHELDVAHGLNLQRIISDAEAQLAAVASG